MVSSNDPMETIFNSIQVVVKDALLPIELGVKKAARDIENCWVTKERDLGLALRSSGRNSKKKKRICAATPEFDDIANNVHCVVSEERKKGLSIKIPVKSLFAMFSPNLASRSRGEVGLKKDKSLEKDDDSCTNCFKFAMTWSLLVSGFVHAFPIPFKIGKKRIHKLGDDDENSLLHSRKHCLKSKASTFATRKAEKEGNPFSIECAMCFVVEMMTQNLQKLDQFLQDSSENESCCSKEATTRNDSPLIFNIWEARKLDVNGFLGNLMFARVGDVASGIAGLTSPMSGDVDESNVSTAGKDESAVDSPQNLASGLLSIPLSNVERLKSTLSTISLTELIELLPQLGRPSRDHPDKKKLISVQDFFRYTESEGRRFFEELDRDGDGKVTLEDLEIAMRRRKLPRRYAKEFMRRARSHLFSKSFGWKQFLSLMEQKEPTILRAYTSLCLTKSGTLQKSEILASLDNAGLPANEENAIAMMRFLKADAEESISYGHFRNFMVLLPYERLQDDPRNIWFEAATVVAVAPPVALPAGDVLKSALAGGLASALSTSLLHPIDTIKTRVQASTLSFPEVIAKLPEIGVRGVYRGSIPAILGQFSSHGLRTGIFEASKLVLINFAPNLPEIQVQSIASFCSTLLGTAVRIPCEVLKQRLQAGMFNNVGEAIVGTWKQDGPRGFFRGTGATLCREVPLYVVGMGLYAESKKMVAQALGRELEAWETIAVGAVSGGIAAVVTTPFDVMKTRMMTATPGRPISMSMVVVSILRNEGPLGLFKGAVPRFFWVAPLGAMNFAGYELAKKAMQKNEEAMLADQLGQKKLC
ncbi:PREDICTED: mitochondrial substrate carrier family protein C isoform X2 [Camelina sativa]|uniref:Mitochondrial substrate carrier family protein C isoform X1 n=1 Tax=Camelina sativa TaxID=90675 RepID=A0ABM1RTZ3_CAMSA|nr:PREDICTED: mitochondrial substrate carrier family protein C isoform X1 [Camelina sativa]XP_019102481.1 PREDICTED: mitochondrial substrate carrier family protein C isoform X2 [Camelina sativa]